MLEGMPEPGSLRLLAHEGETVVLSGRWVLFRFPVADTGMRRLAMIALTEAGHPVKTVAAVFGVHPNYLSTLRKTAREQGSGGLVKAMGRPVKLSAAQLARARRWAEQGMTGQEIAGRLDVSGTMISRLVSADRHRPEPVQDELPDPELLDPPLPDPALVEPVDAEPDPVDADPVVADPVVVDPVVAGPENRPIGAGSARLVEATVDSRYAGAMLLHGFFDRVGAQAVLAPLTGTNTDNGTAAAGRRCDDVALLTATTVAFALGAGSVEAGSGRWPGWPR